MTRKSLYIEHESGYESTSADWDNVPPEKMRQALMELRRILGKPTTLNTMRMK